MKNIVTISVLKLMLSRGNVKFSYKRTNGEMREAIGTTNKQTLDRIGVQFSGESSSCGEEKTVVYYDVEKNAWRSLSTEYNKTVMAEAI